MQIEISGRHSGRLIKILAFEKRVNIKPIALYNSMPIFSLYNPIKTYNSGGKKLHIVELPLSIYNMNKTKARLKSKILLNHLTLTTIVEDNKSAEGSFTEYTSHLAHSTESISFLADLYKSSLLAKRCLLSNNTGSSSSSRANSAV